MEVELEMKKIELPWKSVSDTKNARNTLNRMLLKKKSDYIYSIRAHRVFKIHK